MSTHITTYTGLHMDPTDPKPEDFRAEDIAHALSLICRGNGHVKTFFSVGQHCLLCAREALARGYGRRVALACLLHDAGECYMSDVPRPFKSALPEYRAMEDHLLSLLYTKYLGSDLTQEEAARVKEIDDDLLYYDLKELLNDPPARPAPVLQVRISREVLPFEEVEDQYLTLFKQLSKEE